MTEEEYFRKCHPDSCYGDKPLSPHWDFFQEGVEFGERQSEKRIEELEEENKTLSRKANEAIANKLLITAKYNEVLNDLNQENDKLQKENAELKAQIEKMKNCKNCANYMISGKCPSFFRTGWCKNWEMTRSKM